MRFAAISAALIASLLASNAFAEKPWYDRGTCKRATESVMAGDFDDADKRLKELEKSRDADDQACGVWARLLLAELQLGFAGKLPALIKNRDSRLKRMYGFSKAHAKRAARFADLEIEARMKRIRYLAEDGKRGAALKEAKRVGEMLERRAGKGSSTPTLEYSQGVSNLAVAFASWPVRMVMKLAGMSGEGEVGAKYVQGLYKGESVYKFETAYILRVFAAERPDDILGKPHQYSGYLVKSFPTNPLYMFEYAEDMRSAKDCRGAMSFLQPVQSQLEKDPAKWSERVRARLYWISGRCALDLGDKPTARRYAELAKAQRQDEIEDKLEDLFDQL